MKKNRRNFIATLGAGAAGMTLGFSKIPVTETVLDNKSNKNEDDQLLLIGDNIALTKTQYGKVKGYKLRNIYYFLGMPYGADTSGKNRFMPPQKPKPWDDVFQAIWWGDSAPQIMEKKYASFFNGFLSHLNYADLSEDCLKLNVFTPGYNDGKKRPVMVWLHGGGFTNGNGIEQDEYNGENFCRFGDVVFCSINHRLGPLGFTNLASAGGKKYAASGNVGMLDIVAALEWVRDNIAYFGGDPNNVTIMGQSGGGAKVTTLTAMPKAKGLFHKAVVLSGAGIKSGEKEYSEKLGLYILREAQLSKKEINKLQDIPWLDYIQLANNASKKLRLKITQGNRRGFSPVVDGYYLPQHPYSPEAAPTAADIPMLICSTMNEAIMHESELDKLTMGGLKERLKSNTGDKTDKMVDAYAKIFPNKSPAELLTIIYSNGFRKPSVELANIKSKQSAPVYIAWFWWQPPLFNNRLRAFHCLDISFWFYNTDLMLTHTGGGARPRKLSEKMASSLVQFMKTGNPNCDKLPVWEKYSEKNRVTMILDDISELKVDPDREARELL
ncbi:carboxylesterase/lipase family protein [Flavivirga spongiicola]|uniref:Carboxylic ester hydrolase n=1 Tax=Flavivirga spongiicola TaxID=421621 RepID=A0ABU7XPM2_9FLAO|nr:carboxylesterase family protein [Flavivirga sp. MEBiC05379]MDO5977520.1 carboxylesterase family protein [Flavivirga sp. MEBiC05379]